MNTTLCLLVGLLYGMALSYGHFNGHRKVAIGAGLIFGVCLGTVCLLGGGDWLVALGCMGTTVVGSVIASYLPVPARVIRILHIRVKK